MNPDVNLCKPLINKPPPPNRDDNEDPKIKVASGILQAKAWAPREGAALERLRLQTAQEEV